jgi:hypothetical protein
MSDTANNTTAYDSMSKPEQEAFDAEARAKEASEQAGQCSATHERNSTLTWLKPYHIVGRKILIQSLSASLSRRAQEAKIAW